MVSKQKILIVDDDNNIAELISLYLTKECFETMIANDGESALLMADSFAPNLILLDLMLPGIDGYQVCREIRAKSSIPIIMLSAKGEIFDKVLGLELGADDYMEKPFDSKELVARVKAVLRRYKPVSVIPASADVKCVEYPDLVINQTNYSVIYMGKTVEMPPKELELLYFLASSPNHVFTREQLARLLDRNPTTFANVALDNRGIVYTVTLGSRIDPIKKHKTNIFNSINFQKPINTMFWYIL